MHAVGQQDGWMDRMIECQMDRQTDKVKTLCFLFLRCRELKGQRGARCAECGVHSNIVCCLECG